MVILVPVFLSVGLLLTAGQAADRLSTQPSPNNTSPAGVETPLNLMPVPASLEVGNGYLAIDPAFRTELVRYREPRLERAVTRLVDRLSRQTGIYFELAAVAGKATLEIECEGPAAEVQSAIEDESYELVVTRAGARLRAPNPYGVLRGIETFLQLVELGDNGFRVPVVTIEDRPRFPWRGLLIDVARHWIPPEVIKRNLDGMAALKMNVLHWHLSEDQGFRVESKLFPKLHELGSDGRFFTQDEVREIIEYARDRGIRVVPEFDMPGHTTAWFVGHPELASAPGPYTIERRWGVFDPAMDPTREEVYDFLDAFLGEMAGLFPDPFLHIGGDEVNGKQWDANLQIQKFMRDNDLQDNHALQGYFNRRVQAILAGHGKKMVGWDEIFQSDLPKDIVVQSWRGQESLAESARQGYSGILSNGYYLDHILPASLHYAVDPLSGEAANLSLEEQRLVLGGEACMWAEFVTFETIDSRIWPRAAAVAERLWSPADVQDVDDMYRRLDVTGQRLDLLGLTHRSGYEPMLRRLTNYGPIEALKNLADVVEPVKYYERPSSRPYTSQMPLNRLVDAARPESEVAREFSGLVDAFLADLADTTFSSAEGSPFNQIQGWLRRWSDNHRKLTPVIKASPALAEIDPLSRNLQVIADLGQTALARISGERATPESVQVDELQALTSAAEAKAELLIMIEPAIRKLMEAAYNR